MDIKFKYHRYWINKICINFFALSYNFSISFVLFIIRRTWIALWLTGKEFTSAGRNIKTSIRFHLKCIQLSKKFGAELYNWLQIIKTNIKILRHIIGEYHSLLILLQMLLWNSKKLLRIKDIDVTYCPKCLSRNSTMRLKKIVVSGTIGSFYMCEKNIC